MLPLNLSPRRMDNPAVNNYIQFFERRLQHGSGFDYPVFTGARFNQQGSGFGDILKGIFRFIFPIAARGVSTFVGEAVRAHETGADWKTAAKSALLPTAQNVTSKALDQIREALAPPLAVGSGAQSGSGKRRRPHPQYKKAKKAKYENWNF